MSISTHTQDKSISLRLEKLKTWLAQELGHEPVDIKPASTDASFRHYYRCEHDGRSLIIMDAPPDKEETGPFISISRMLRSAGLNAPEIIAADPEQGFLLLSDLGEQLYLSALTTETVNALYADALEALFAMQTRLSSQASTLPDYDVAFLRQEMELFREWYLKRHCSMQLSGAQETALDEIFSQLAQSAVAQPRVFVHRDFHSRNLMVSADNNPGILDFQDAMIGPVTYDLVSLLRDCYIDWPRERVEAWALAYLRRLVEADIVDGQIDDQMLLRWFDWMGVQRHLKAVGIFARLSLRDNKHAYLGDIPRTLAYLREVCARYKELEPLSALLSTLET